MKKKKHLSSRRLLSALMAAAMTVSLYPVSVMAAVSEDEETTDLQEHIEELLSAGEYTEGQVLALIRDTDSDMVQLAASDLLDKAEVIGSLDQEIYEEYGESFVEEAVDAEVELAQVEEDPTLVCITDPSHSTEELLQELLSDDRVLMAEPNYTDTIESADENTDELLADAVDEVILADTDEENAASVDADSSEDISTEDTSSDDISVEETAATQDAPAAKNNLISYTLPSDEEVDTASVSCGPDLTQYQWGYQNDGTLFTSTTGGSLENFDINPDNWDTYNADGTPVENATGVVCIMDTGIDYTNPDLANVMISNMKDYNKSGGYYGFNASNNDTSEPLDVHGHGTHCAGIVAAEWNHQGTSGAASGCQLCAVRMGEADGSVSTLAAVRGYKYLSTAIDNGLELVAVSCSWGGYSYPGSLLNLMIAEVGSKGAISLFAAGNFVQNHDKVSHTTSYLSNPYVVIVDSASYDGVASYFSDYGSTSTDVYAPGTNILSTCRTNQLEYSALTEMNPVVRELFHEDTTGLIFAEDELAGSREEITAIEETRNTEVGYEGKDCGQVKLSDMTINEEENTCSCIIYLPINPEELSQLDKFTVTMTTDAPGENALVPMRMELPTGKSAEDPQWITALQTTVGLGKGVWSSGTFSFAQKISDASLALLQEKGEDQALLPLRFTFGTDKLASPEDIDNVSIYFDAFCIGSDPAPYTWMSGTSMATPAVAGAAAIIAKRQADSGVQLYDEETRAEAAKDRANTLKGSVSHYEFSEDTCRSGGMLDLSLTEDAYTPVINSLTWREVSYESGEAEILTIKGAYFGDSVGSASVDSIASFGSGLWSSDQIDMNMTSVPATDNYTVTVTSANGKTGKNCLTLSTTSTNSLFEGNVELPSTDLSQNGTMPVLTSGGGMLYAAFENALDGTYSALWQYDPESDQWLGSTALPTNSIGSLPSAVSLAADARYVYILAAYADVRLTDYYTSSLYVYDTQAGTMENITVQDLPVMSALVCTGGRLYLIGGGYMKRTIVDSTYTCTVNKAGKLWRLQMTGDNTAELKDLGDTGITELDSPAIAAAGGSYALSAVAAEDGFYVLYIDALKSTSDNFFSLQKFTISNDKFTMTDMSSTIPKAATDYASTYVYRRACTLAAVEGGLILSGAYLNKDGTGADTYLLKDGAENFVKLEKKANTDLFEYASACAVDGKLYVAGVGTKDTASLFIHTTDMAAAKQQTNVQLTAKSAVYTGKQIRVADAKVTGSTGAVTYKYYLDEACTKKTTKTNSGAASNYGAPVNVGTYYVTATVAADDIYAKAVSLPVKLVITKKAPTLKVKVTSKTLKYARVKTAKRSFATKASVTGNGTLSYKAVKFYGKAGKYLTVGKKTGKIFVKKGTPKGTYKVKIRVTAKASANYKSGTLDKIIKVTVK